jgi:hypothetical protein
VKKQKLNAVLEKENTRRTIRVKTRVFYAMKTECVFSKINMLGSPQQTKQKKTESKNKNAPRTTHSIWSNKNIVSWKMTWYFCWWRRGCLGHPQALTLVLLGYLLGWHGHPQAWAFVHSLSHLISSFSFPYTWKLPSYKTSHNSH